MKSQTDYEIIKNEIELIERLSNDEVCRIFNAESKEEYLVLLNSELEVMKLVEESYDYSNDEQEAERTYLCVSQGLARFC